MRKEQAQERHDKEMAKHWQPPSKELRVLEWKNVEGWAANEARFKTEQKPLKDKAKVAAAQQAAVNMGRGRGSTRRWG